MLDPREKVLTLLVEAVLRRQAHYDLAHASAKAEEILQEYDRSKERPSIGMCHACGEPIH